MDKQCPKCDEEMEFIDPEPDVGIGGGWYCSECDCVLPPDDDEDVMSWGQA